MQELSIIIPTYNEEENIVKLVERIHTVLSLYRIPYEIIFIDDHSTDRTPILIENLTQTYPIKLFFKKGNKGKAQSLIEGFVRANCDLICMIDADLQYPPEAIPQMVQKIAEGADLVVANRKKKEIGFLRTIISDIYNALFNKLLHNFNVDVQSGLKVFKKELIQRVSLGTGKWAIDLELLIKARNAGYKIVDYDITFAKRDNGRTKINLITASWEIGVNALLLKFRQADIIPFHPNRQLTDGNGFHYKGKSFVHHSQLHINEMAFFRLDLLQKVLFLLIGVLLFDSFLLNWHLTLLALLIASSLLYFLDIFFNFFLIIQSFRKYPEIKITKEEMQEIQDEDLPAYTILCPLYKEWHVVPQFVTAMSNLDYPKDKLQVMLLLEEDDEETLKKVGEFSLPGYFDVVVVPDSQPKTKPKACNYGLKHATGEYSVIYDAEDIPETDQLKKTVRAFQKADRKVACVQAKLNYFNPYHNMLTRVFTAEYSLWFDLILTGLQSINAPIPLGGTSNHFRTNDLKKLKGWDAFNVTEDCDLGLRLVKQGFQTAIVDSTTYEEANSSLYNWLGQRSRWIKGYIQSYLVHMRNPGDFSRNGKTSHFFTFQLIVGGKIFSLFINPIFWLMTILYFVFRPELGPFIQSLFPGPLLYLGVFSAIVGNFLYFYYYMVGCARRGYYDLIKFGLLVPLYWLMMSVAAWIAVYKIITQPHYWFKTKHGLQLATDITQMQVLPVVEDNVIDQKATNLPSNINYQSGGLV
jgi:glycosyltransferase XagB